MDALAGGRMDGWMVVRGQGDGWTYGWLDLQWTDTYVEVYTNVCLTPGMAGWLVGWMDGWIAYITMAD